MLHATKSQSFSVLSCYQAGFLYAYDQIQQLRTHMDMDTGKLTVQAGPSVTALSIIK